MLIYGDAAQNYVDYNTDNLASSGTTGLTVSTACPEGTDTTHEKHKIDSAAGFYSAGVRFGNVKYLYVKLMKADDLKVTVTVNGAGKDCTSFIESDNYYVLYTDGILPTKFDTVYTFELYVGDILVSTLTHSVRSYIYAKMNDTETPQDGGGSAPTEMATLALALYRFGDSAEKYVA